jgi:hypothetical protein
MPQADQRWTGIAPACFLAVLCATAVSKNNGNNDGNLVDSGILYWLLFVFTSGLFTNPNAYTTKKEQFLFTLIPTACLLIAWLLIPTLWLVVGAPYDKFRQVFLMLRFLIPILLIITPPFLFIAAFCRENIFGAIDRPKSDYERWSSNLRMLLIIISISLTIWSLYK